VQVTPLRETVASLPKSLYTGCRQQGHAGSKICPNKTLQFLTGCHQMQVVLCNGCKTVAVAVVVVVAAATAAAVVQ